MLRRVIWMAFGGILALWGRRQAIDTVERHVPPQTRARLMPFQERLFALSRQATDRVGAELLFAVRAYVRAKRAVIRRPHSLTSPSRRQLAFQGKRLSG